MQMRGGKWVNPLYADINYHGDPVTLGKTQRWTKVTTSEPYSSNPRGCNLLSVRTQLARLISEQTKRCESPNAISSQGACIVYVAMGSVRHRVGGPIPKPILA
jgi:hypothetical protein